MPAFFQEPPEFFRPNVTATVTVPSTARIVLVVDLDRSQTLTTGALRALSETSANVSVVSVETIRDSEPLLPVSWTAPRRWSHLRGPRPPLSAPNTFKARAPAQAKRQFQPVPHRY